MRIQTGIKHKKFLGLHLRIKAPSFHKTFKTFGSTGIIADFNHDATLRTPPDQNNPDPLFGTPAQPNGCGGEGVASVIGDLQKILYNPFYPYQQMCLAEGQSTTEPVGVDYILNEPIISGLQAYGESVDHALNHKILQWYEVAPLNGSLFEGILTAMHISGTSVAFAGTWFASFEDPIDGVIRPQAGPFVGHFWKFCGLKTINGVSYLVALPWIGKNWGDKGFCYFSEQILNQNDGQAFIPMAGFGQPVLVGRYTVLESLIHFIQKLLAVGEGGTKPAFSVWEELEEEVEIIENEITQYTMADQPAPQTAPSKFSPMIIKWSEAIAHGEGASPASNNPGNLKFSTLTESWGAIKGRAASDGGFLCQFQSLQEGQNALCNFLKLGAENLLVAFHQARTLQSFTEVYAGNPPQGYIDVIGEMLGVSLETSVSTFL